MIVDRPSSIVHRRSSIVLVVAVCGLLPAVVSAQQLTIELQDFVTMPMTGRLDGTGQTDGMLSRVNGLREEPGGARRVFINDMNGPLYIVDKATKKFTTYLDFNGRDARAGLFHRLTYEAGYGTGFAHFQFDPDYARNGRFYTVHIENPEIQASNLPDNTNIPGFKTADYTTTAAIATPGPLFQEAVLVEWTDANIKNDTFEGTARELMRVQLNARIHPMGEIAFNPNARRGDPEWRVMYIGMGDGGAGEARTMIRQNPQRLDTLVGKILRIIPDLSEQTATSTISENGRYRVPKDNPFVSTPGARKEIWAYGLRNPHRLNWAEGRLIATSIGLRTWETVNIIKKGANYGYSQREGNELLQADNTTTRLPDVDKIATQIGDEVTDAVVVPTYPVVEYPHKPGGGDAIGSGYLYNGKAVPALRGKYVFTDLSTGRIWWVDFKEMLAADDGDPNTLAKMHEVKILWNGQSHDTMFTVTMAAYKARGGQDPDLPGRGAVSGAGRADARLSVDAAGELYLFSKTDGVIRAIVGAK
ncbi:MAG: PQQ-dependent sugar dehydrogenase [Vicinamibacterales bacterium]|nr:PQQ-dependent sugar dehydrogenase [Vicinamibacterales bacterium]